MASREPTVEHNGEFVELKSGETVTLGRGQFGIIHPKVSRKQVALTYDGTSIFAKLLGINPSFIIRNGFKLDIPKDSEMSLREGDVISLARDDVFVNLKFPVAAKRKESPPAAEPSPKKARTEPSKDEDWNFNAEASKLKDQEPAEESSGDELPVCIYDGNCFRKNPQHFLEFSHPQQNLKSKSSSESASASKSKTTGKPACKYGAACYQKNPDHLAAYSHTSDTSSASGSKPQPSSKPDNQSSGKDSSDVSIKYGAKPGQASNSKAVDVAKPAQASNNRAVNPKIDDQRILKVPEATNAQKRSLIERGAAINEPPVGKSSSIPELATPRLEPSADHLVHPVRETTKAGVSAHAQEIAEQEMEVNKTGTPHYLLVSPLLSVASGFPAKDSYELALQGLGADTISSGKVVIIPSDLNELGENSGLRHGDFIEILDQVSKENPDSKLAVVVEVTWRLKAASILSRKLISEDILEKLKPSLPNGGLFQKAFALLVPAPTGCAAKVAGATHLILTYSPNINPLKTRCVDIETAKREVKESWQCINQLIQSSDSENDGDRDSEQEGPELTAVKSVGSSDKPPSGYWKNALEDYAKNPSAYPGKVELLCSDKIAAVPDKFPKSLVHYLFIPRPGTQTCSTKAAIAPTWRELNANGCALLDQAVEEFVRRRKLNRSELLIGFHASPSMRPVHLHVMTRDLLGPNHKTRQHFLSFTSPSYFLSLERVTQAIKGGPFAKPLPTPEEAERSIKNVEFLKCHICGKEIKSFPDMKTHLQEHR